MTFEWEGDGKGDGKGEGRGLEEVALTMYPLVVQSVTLGCNNIQCYTTDMR